MWSILLLQPGGIQLLGSTKVHFSRIHSGTCYLRSSFWQLPISSSSHLLSCFSICYIVLKSCLYKLDSYSRWMAMLIYTLLGGVAELAFQAREQRLDLELFEIDLCVYCCYAGLCAASPQLQKQHSPFPSFPCPKPSTEQAVIISFILLPGFFQFSLNVCSLIFLSWDVCFRINKVCFNFSKMN